MFIKKIISFINDIRIRNKLIIIYVIVILVPILVVGTYFSQSMRDIVINRAIEEARVSNDRIKYRFNETIKLADNISGMVYVNKNLQKIVEKNYFNKYELIEDFQKFTIFNDAIANYGDIASIRFYTYNKTVTDNSQMIYASDKILNSYWYLNTIEKDGRVCWQYLYDDIAKQNYLSLTRLVKKENSNIIGTLVMNLNDVSLNSIIKDEPFETIITLDNNKIINARNKNLVGMNLINNGSEFLVSNETIGNSVEYKYDIKKYTIIKTEIMPEKTSNSFTIYNLVPVINILQKADKVTYLSFSILGLCLIFSFVLILFFSIMISKRIIKLREEMQKIVLGDFNTEIEIEGKDEIGELFKDLNIMKESLKKLILEVYEEKIQREQLSKRQKEAEFKMLASQINPHFLYNTLETIRMKAYCNKQEDIADVVKMLAKIMRRNLEVKDKTVSLQSEIDIIKNYLEIQKFRFGERVNFKIVTECDISGYYILPLIIQPIVENAFIHGVENKEGDGMILINVEKQDGYIIISIVDDGVGIDENNLTKLNKDLNDFNVSDNKSIGLCNVNQRIKLYYGDMFGIGIHSKPNVGTKVEIKLPLNGEETFNVKAVNN